MFRPSLAGRITLIVLTGMMVAWLGVLTSFYWSRHLEKIEERLPVRQVVALVALLEQVPADLQPQVLDAAKSRFLDPRLDPNGTSNGPSAAPALSAKDLAGYAAALGDRPLTATFRQPSGLGRRLLRLFGFSGPIQLHIGLKTGETLVLNARPPVFVTRLGLPVGFGAGLFGTLVAFVALIAMNREMRPLAKLAAAIKVIAPGERMDLPSTRAPEIKALVDAFNGLQGRLAHLLRARMAMVGGISHDVRSFATRLRLRADLIPEGPDRERAINDISDMIRLLDDALLASRAGAGELLQELVEFDEVVRDEVEDRKAAGLLVDLHSEAATAGVMLLGDRLAIRRIISNLVENAIKYGRAAHVSLRTEKQTALLIVDDEGKGIPADLREILLEPFVRLEPSRSRRTGGAGLGLAIVRSLVDAHGGSVAIDVSPTGGARFVVRLPMFREA